MRSILFIGMRVSCMRMAASATCVACLGNALRACANGRGAQTVVSKSLKTNGGAMLSVASLVYSRCHLLWMSLPCVLRLYLLAVRFTRTLIAIGLSDIDTGEAQDS